jgi:4'-phosphopantetheinyl transferase
MVQQRLPVFDWPNDAGRLSLENGLLVIGLQTPPAKQRQEARQLVRVAIQEVLALLLHCAASEIDLLTQAGQAIKLLNAHQNIGLSISHEVGLSLFAINMYGPIGIDLIAINSVPNDLELRTLAIEYLGVKVAEGILSEPIERHKEAFAMAWTEFEASLKVKGEALIEWSAARDEKLKSARVCSLALGDGYIGAIAYETIC